MPEKGEKEQFVVSDRRKFTAEGDLREGFTPSTEEPMSNPVPLQEQPASSQPPNSSAPAISAETPSGEKQSGEEMPTPPTAAEQHAQHSDYKAAGKKIDSMLDAAGAKRPPDMEMTFEKLVLSLYMTAMMQLGMVRDENVPPRPDIVSARQTIDTIALLFEKTKGNITERESHMLQNCLFELRMAFLEITNMLTTQPPTGGPAAPGTKK